MAQSKTKEKNKRQKMDMPLFIATLILVGLGIIAVLSASAPYALNQMNDSYYFAGRQALYAVLGIAVMIFVSKIDYNNVYKKMPGAIAIFVFAVFLLVLIWVPGLGKTVNGARRWLKLGPISFQPSEVAKIGIIMLYSFMLSSKDVGDKLRSPEKFFKELVRLGIWALPLIGVCVLVVMENHASAVCIIGLLAAVIVLCAGLKKRWIVLGAMLVAVLIVALVVYSPYRLDRLKVWFDPWVDLQGNGWQGAQSLMAVGSGGIFGRGLGNSIQKYMYLPEQYNDFIFAVWCEELGFIGGAALILLFAFWVYRGLSIAYRCKDEFGRYLAIGITTMIGVQAILNIAVVIGLFPITGVSLPFFSYGGTSLLILLASTGVLLNVSKNCEK